MAPSPRGQRPASKLWTHFARLGEHKGRCNYCHALLSVKGGSTSNLNRHLKNKHPSRYCEKLASKSKDKDFSTSKTTEEPEEVPQFEEVEVGESFLAAEMLEVSCNSPAAGDIYERVFSWSNVAILELLKEVKIKKRLIEARGHKREFLWQAVARSLNEKGFLVSDTQCQSKLNYLKQAYAKAIATGTKHPYSQHIEEIFNHTDNESKSMNYSHSFTTHDGTQVVMTIQPPGSDLPNDISMVSSPRFANHSTPLRGSSNHLLDDIFLKPAEDDPVISALKCQEIELFKEFKDQCEKRHQERMDLQREQFSQFMEFLKTMSANTETEGTDTGS